MRKIWGAAAVAALALAWGGTTLAQSGATAAIGKPIRDFALRDIRSGKTMKLSSFRGKPLVIAFMANRCGTTWTYEKEIGTLAKNAKTNGYNVVLVHSNFQESDAEIKGQIETRNIPAPILDDKKTQSLVKYLGAKVTPTFYVVDKAGILRYSGSFDDHHAAPVYVPNAVSAVSMGKGVKTPTTRAFG